MNTSPSLEMIGDPVYARIRERLRHDILFGVFEPGLHLKISDLSRRYAVSQMPVREALQQLQGEGLIILEPNKGAKVRKIDENFIKNIFDIRIAIETMLLQESFSSLNSNDLRQLHSIQAAFEADVRRNDIENCINHDHEFHSLMLQSATNTEAFNLLDKYWALLDSLQRKFGFGHARIPAIIREHRNILSHLGKHDFESVINLNHKHGHNGKEDLIAQIQKEN